VEKPETPHPIHEGRSPKAQTRRHKPETRNPKPETLKHLFFFFFFFITLKPRVE